jgi:subtilisin family serine protease
MAPPPPSPTPTASGFVCHFTASGPAPQTRRVGSYLLRGPSRSVPTDQEIVPGVVAVRVETPDVSKMQAAAALVHGTVSGTFNQQGAFTIALPRGTSPQAASSALRSMPGVVAAGPMIKRFVQGVIPNDPYFNTLPYNGNPNNPIQWDMYITNMPNAWALPSGFGSSTIKVAIIDTGYDTTNTDLTGRVALSIVYDKGTGLPDSGASIQDGDGHGTDVSGIAAADTNNSTYVAGTAGNVKLLEARVFPTPSAQNPAPSAQTIDVAAAINWAVSHGAKVINLSLGSGTPDNTYEEPAVAAAIAAGVSVVAAAGNGNAQGVGQPVLDYPAADPGVIAAGASALCDQAAARNYAMSVEYVASYSNYLPNPSATQYFVVAPGADPGTLQQHCAPGNNACIDFLQWIVNLWSNSAYPPGSGGPAILIAGTSMAAPHVAGVVALMLSKNVSGTLTPALIGSIISANSVQIGDNRDGHGRIDAFLILNGTPP